MKYNWEIELDDYDDVITSSFIGTKKEVIAEMQRIFEDTFDGGITNEGYQPIQPSVMAFCEEHGLTLNLEAKY